MCELPNQQCGKQDVKQQKLTDMANNIIPVREIMRFPMTVEHPELRTIRVVGYKRPYEYMDGIYAYEDAETGEYGGMIVEDDTKVRIVEE